MIVTFCSSVFRGAVAYTYLRANGFEERFVDKSVHIAFGSDSTLLDVILLKHRNSHSPWIIDRSQPAPYDLQYLASVVSFFYFTHSFLIIIYHIVVFQ